MWSKLNLCSPLRGMKTTAVIIGNRMKVGQKVKNIISIWSWNSLLGTYFKKENQYIKQTHVIACLMQHYPLLQDHMSLPESSSTDEQWTFTVSLVYTLQQPKVLLSQPCQNISYFFLLWLLYFLSYSNDHSCLIHQVTEQMLVDRRER